MIILPLSLTEKLNDSLTMGEKNEFSSAVDDILKTHLKLDGK